MQMLSRKAAVQGALGSLARLVERWARRHRWRYWRDDRGAAPPIWHRIRHYRQEEQTGLARQKELALFWALAVLADADSQLHNCLQRSTRTLKRDPVKVERRFLKMTEPAGFRDGERWRWVRSAQGPKAALRASSGHCPEIG